MAATLPPINSKNGVKKVPSYAESSQQVGSTRSGTRASRLKPIAGGNKKEKELHEKRMRLRALQCDLTKEQAANFRHSYRHTLCLEMLKEGFHLSFRELFNLIHEQLAERQQRGPESLMWTQIMLEDEHEKLDMLRQYLTAAETAQRNEDFLQVYQCRYDLAHFFQSTGDKWLSDHFFQSCLEIADSIKTDGGRTKALGHCNVGLSLEENGENFEAADHFEAYFELAKDHKEDWITTSPDGSKISFFTEACLCLYRIYTTIGNQLEARDPEKSLEYLIKAFDKANESADLNVIGESAYRLGLAYEKNGDTQTALMHLNNFFDACKTADNKEGMGRACDAIAKAYVKQGNKEQSIKYLTEFVGLAEECGMDEELSLACHNLGNVLNSMGRYKEAGEYFSRAYNISRAIGEGPAIHINRVQSGIAQAHNMLKNFATHVVRGDSPCLSRIIEWKSVRQSSFSEPIPEPTPPQSAKRAQSPKPRPKPESNENQSADTGEQEASEAQEEEKKEEEQGEGEEATAEPTETEQ